MTRSVPVRRFAAANRARRATRIARTLGPTWVVRRSMVEAKRRSGHLQRRNPVVDWAAVPAGARLRNDLFPTDGPARLLATDESGLDRLQRRGQELAAGRFVAFDTAHRLTDWHTDPLTGFRYPNDRHWTDVPEQVDVDLKMVWEASRFGWAYDLARLAAVDPHGGWGRRFWELFADWRSANRPNEGIHWACGQESSIRLMAVTFAASVCRSDAGEDDLVGLSRFVEQTAARVLSFIDYADSQNNNHLASEAVGLLTAVLLHPGLTGADEAEQVGRRHLERVCRELIFADGGSSQYSLNYHRVYVDNLAWAHRSFQVASLDVPQWLDDALARALDFLVAVVDPVDGSAPFFGADDGARLLPVAESEHRDPRPTIRLAATVLGRDDDLGPGPWSEAGRWFARPGASAGRRPGPAAEPESSARSEAGWRSAIHFPDVGVSVLRRGRDRVTARCGPHRFRPSHADQLHVDVWLDGHQVAFDPGTFSYKPKPGRQPSGGFDLADTAAHNTLFLPERGQMARVSRFLWADWSNGVVEDCAHDPTVAWAGTHFGYTDLGVHHHRRIEEIAGGWRISDRLDATRPRTFTVGWLLDGEVEHVGPDRLALRLPDGFRYEVRWRTQVGAGTGPGRGMELTAELDVDPESPATWFCAGYRQRRSMIRLHLSARTAADGVVTDLVAVGPDSDSNSGSGSNSGSDSNSGSGSGSGD